MFSRLQLWVPRGSKAMAHPQKLWEDRLATVFSLAQRNTPEKAARYLLGGGGVTGEGVR